MDLRGGLFKVETGKGMVVLELVWFVEDVEVECLAVLILCIVLGATTLKTADGESIRSSNVDHA